MSEVVKIRDYLNIFSPCNNCPDPEAAKAAVAAVVAERTVDRLSRGVNLKVTALVIKPPEDMLWAVESMMVGSGELVCNAGHPSRFHLQGCPLVEKATTLED